MKYITVIKDPGAADAGVADGKTLNELFNGPFRRIVEVSLRDGAVLARHHALEPITVYCVSGSGVFTAGTHLEDSHDLRPGTLITLDAGVEHEVSAEPDLHLIVSKFKGS